MIVESMLHLRLLQVRNTMNLNQNLYTYCFQNVKSFDYENYLATLLLPPYSRNGVFAVRAFNVELAKVGDATSEELMARMRYQFWRETIDKIYQNKPTENPVAKSLFEAKKRHNFSKKWLKNLIESRDKRISSKLFSSLEELEIYAEESNASLYYLILQCLGVENVRADHVASHLGKSEGIAKVIRSIPYFSSRSTVVIPRTILVQHKVPDEDIIRCIRSQSVKDVVYDLASAAHRHKEEAKKLEKDAPKTSKLAFLPLIAVEEFLTQLQKCDFDVFDSRLRKRNGLLPIKLLRAKLKLKFGF